MPRAGRLPLGPLLAFGAGLAVLLALYRLNLAVPLNSDQGSSILEAAAMRRGNFLLRGWVLPPDTFYTTRVPLLAILQAIEGAAPNLFAQSSALLGIAVALSGTLLVRGWWGKTLTFLLLASPAYVDGTYLLLPGGSDHAGTVALMLLALVALDRRPGRPAAHAAAAALLGFATVGDPMAAWIGCGAIAVSALLRLAAGAGGRRSELWLLATAAGGFVLAVGAWHAIHLLGGFGRAEQPLALVGADHVPAHAALTVRALLTVFGADLLRGASGPALVPPLLHLAGLAAAVAAAIAVLVKAGRGRHDRVAEILLAGIVVNLAAFFFNSQSGSILQSRYLLPALAFGAVLVGREASGLLRGRRRLALVAALVAAYAGVIGWQAAAARPAEPPTASVQRFLARRHLTEGLGDYWQASVITAASRGHIHVRAVTALGGQVQSYLWLANRAWYTAPRRAARFVVFDTRAPDAIERSTLISAFGVPAEVHKIERYEVLIWRADLYRKVTTPP